MSHDAQVLPRAARSQAPGTQRNRLIVALADVVARKGYGPASVADVIAEAGMSRRTFYEHFAGKEDCFLAAYDAGVEIMLGELAEVLARSGSWQDRLDATLRRFLELLAGEPAFARIAYVESLAASDAARERYNRVAESFRELLRAFHEQALAEDPAVVPVSDVVLDALAGGINRVMTRRVLAGEGERVGEHFDDLRGVVLALVAGSDERLRDPLSRP